MNCTNKITIVKSLFCPNQKYFDATYKSILNNINYVTSLNLKIKIILIGWIKEKYREKLDITINLLKDLIQIETIYWDKNYGKIKLYHSFNIFFKNCDYILYLDHDIYFDIIKTQFDKILLNLDILFNQCLFSVLTFNQLEDCRHQPSINNNTIVVNDCHYASISIGISDINIDVAGGCFIIKKMNMIDPPFLHVYGFDEKYLMMCTNNAKNCVLLDCYIVHPYDLNDTDNLDYKKWKINNIYNKLDIYDVYDEKQYEKEMELSEFYWQSAVSRE